MSISPVADANGWFTHFISVERDVSEKMAYEIEIIKSIIKTQEDERFEIGGELHDNICQILATSKIAFKMLEKNMNVSDKIWFEQGIEQINLVFKEIRNLSHRLAPAFFKDGTLEELLSSLVKTFNIEDNYNIILEFDDSFKKYASSREFQLNLYRIIQEQLSNILKYAEAKNIIISGFATADSLKLMIQDDGIGLNAKTIKSGIGIANMKRRAELFGGKLIIKSELGKGYTITIEIPLSEVR
jgi:signal transduction histidine kinase